VRKKEESDIGRVVRMPIHMWFKVLNEKEKIEEAIRAEAPYSLSLNDSGQRVLSVEEWEMDNNWYVCFKSLSEKNTVYQLWTINFPPDEFLYLLANAEDVSAALNKNKPRKRKQVTNAVAKDELQLIYHWKLTGPGDEVLKGAIDYFTRADARDAGEEAKKGWAVTPARLEVSSNFVPIWDELSMTRACFYMLAWQQITGLANKENCRACAQESRVIDDHDCLHISESPEEIRALVQAHLSKVWDQVSVSQLGRVIHETRRRINGSDIHSWVYGKSCKGFSNSTLEEKAMIAFLQDSTAPRFRTVRKACMACMQNYLFTRTRGERIPPNKEKRLM